MDVIVGPALRLAILVVDLYMWAVIVSVIMGWLVAFNVVNLSNRFVYMAGDFLHRITEPALAPIRRVLPNLGGLDLSPVVVILILFFIKDILIQIAFRLA